MINFAYEVFREVVRQGTFIDAAKQLNITPSAVSHSINNLESQLGFPIFTRNRNGAKLTNEGRQILPNILSIVNDEEKLSEQAARIKGLSEGQIRIGGFSSVCINWLPDIINRFKKIYPEIKISVYQSSFNDIVQQVNDGTLDVGFVALPIKENLEVIELYKDEIFCITPSGFVPKDKQTIQADDLIDETFILQQVDYDKDTKKALDTYNVSQNSINYSIDDASIIAMVESGLGLGILPNLALKKLTGNVNQYPFNQKFFRTLGLVAAKKDSQSPSTQAFIKVVVEYINERYQK